MQQECGGFEDECKRQREERHVRRNVRRPRNAIVFEPTLCYAKESLENTIMREVLSASSAIAVEAATITKLNHVHTWCSDPNRFCTSCGDLEGCKYKQHVGQGRHALCLLHAFPEAHPSTEHPLEDTTISAQSLPCLCRNTDMCASHAERPNEPNKLSQHLA